MSETSRSSEIIKNVENVRVASNELLLRATINRNLKRLLDNDIALLSNANEVYHGLYRIMPYEYGKVYSKNELAWFADFYCVDSNKPLYDEAVKNYEKEIYPDLSADTFAKHKREAKQTGKVDWEKDAEKELKQKDAEEREKLKDKFWTTTLYLLRSLKSGNDNPPEMTLIDYIPTFDASGWKNEFPFGAIYTDYFTEFTAYNLKKQLSKMHEVIKKYHPFGELSSYNEIPNKVLKTDISNIDPHRTHTFFPGETGTIEEMNSIMSGTYRKYDCGLLEYDLIFKLGDNKGTYAAYNPDGSLITIDNVDVNYLDLKNTETKDNLSCDNTPYYLSDDDSTIFKLAGSKHHTEGNIKQNGLNTVVNTYSGTIRFPIPFKDTNYMIFGSGIASITSDAEDEVMMQNVNTIVYTNKAKQSVTAVMIVPSYDDHIKVLSNNRFRCQIIGRWDIDSKQ